MDKLFIEIYKVVSENNEVQIYTTVESFLALYVYRYLASPSNIKLLALNVTEKAIENKHTIQLNALVLKNAEDCENYNEELSAIHDLRLPIYAKEDNIFIAGLCAVCRELVGRHSEKKFHELLGFKSSCLQSSSEASVWTRFCEVDIVEAIRSILRQTHLNEAISVLPMELVRFEKHMNEPVRMHNIYKLAREQANSGNAKKVIIKCTTPKENLYIAHRYVEGICFTIADLLLYPSVQILLSFLSNISQHLPTTYQWLKEVDENFPVCCELLNALIVPIQYISTTNNYKIPDAPAISLYKSDPKRYKPRQRIYTAQTEVDATLAKLQALQLQFNSETARNYAEPHVVWSLIEPEHERTSALPTKRIERKRQQLENLSNATATLVQANARIIDFCAGTGHLGLLLALQLPACKIILLENKANSLMRAKKRATELGLSNLLYYQCNIDYFKGDFDIGMSLHACGTATDIVLAQCLRAAAAFVCCPCCYGALQPMPHIKYPLSKQFRSVLEERDFLHLAHTADQAHALGTVNCREETTRQGQLCMDIVDTDRKLQAEEYGYEVILTRLQPENCTPKNRLLVGIPTK